MAKKVDHPKAAARARKPEASNAGQASRPETVPPRRSKQELIALCYDKGLVGGRDFAIRIGTAAQIAAQLAYLNDWRCLVETGRAMGPRRDQPKLDTLEEFLDNCSDRSALERFHLKISTGELGCLMCAESATEFAEMKKYILSASELRDEYRARIAALLDQLDGFFGPGECDPAVVERISSRQYLRTGVARDDYLG